MPSSLGALMIAGYFADLSYRLLRATPLVAVLTCFSIAAQAEVTISDQPTRAMKCAKGVCKPKKVTANLNVTELANMLAIGDVKVVSDSATIDMRFTAPLSWTGSSRLTLDSYHSIVFEQPVTVAGAGGAVTIVTSDGGIDGDFWFTPGNHLDFWDLNSSLIINGQTYKLVKTVHALAKAVAKKPAGFYALAKSYNAKKDGTYAQSPVGDIEGTFEGLGNAISNVSVNDTATGVDVGFFEGIGGAVHNINIVNITISAPGANNIVGGIAGGGGDVVHSSVSGSVSAGGSVGGISGYSAGHIRFSHAAVNVHSLSGPAGGLVGEMLGRTDDWTIEQSFATGNVTADGCCAGGLVGNVIYGGDRIVFSYATGSVSGVDGGYVGGLVGLKNYFANETYATGMIVGGPNICSGGYAGVDGLTWEDGSNYWDIDTSGTDQATCAGDAAGVLGLTTEQFKSGLPSGFDPTIWGQRADINNGYPYLLANPPPK
jgi:hypothetical protein